MESLEASTLIWLSLSVEQNHLSPCVESTEEEDGKNGKHCMNLEKKKNYMLPSNLPVTEIA